MRLKIITQIVCFLLISAFSIAQNETKIQDLKKQVENLSNEVNILKNTYKPGDSKFLLRGYAHSGLFVNSDEFSFEGGAFNPLFVYKQSNRLMFEGELEMELEDGELHIGLEYANISYLLTDNMTLRLGKILTPFGIYVTNLHPAWINKFASNPLGLGHDGILPSSDIGIEIDGVTYFASMKVNYSFYVINGAQLNIGSAEPEEAGKLMYGQFRDNNTNKTVGGRIGIFPFKDSSLELGLSYMDGVVGTDKTDLFNISSKSFGLDLSYVKSLPFLSSVVDIKAQYARISTDNALYVFEEEHEEEEEEGDDHLKSVEGEEEEDLHPFDNVSSTYFAQISLRPSMLEDKFFRNLEFAARYSNLKGPEGSEWESDLNRWELGLNYWLDWRTVIKFTYQINSGFGGHGHGAEDLTKDAFFIHWTIGF